MTPKTKYKNKAYYLGEKLTHAGMTGNQLSVALPYWMKHRLRELSAEHKQSISGLVINMLLEKPEFNEKEKTRIQNET